MTITVRQPSPRQEQSPSYLALQGAVEAVLESCRALMDLELKVEGQPLDPRQAQLAGGSGLDLVGLDLEGQGLQDPVTERATGAWRLAILCNATAGREFTRKIFAMDEDEEPAVEDLTDALGEIVRTASDGLKAACAAAGREVRTGRPAFLDAQGCDGFLHGGIKGLAQTLRGPGDFEAHLVLVRAKDS